MIVLKALVSVGLVIIIAQLVQELFESTRSAEETSSYDIFSYFYLVALFMLSLFCMWWSR